VSGLNFYFECFGRLRIKPTVEPKDLYASIAKARPRDSRPNCIDAPGARSQLCRSQRTKATRGYQHPLLLRVSLWAIHEQSTCHLLKLFPLLAPLFLGRKPLRPAWNAPSIGHGHCVSPMDRDPGIQRTAGHLRSLTGGSYEHKRRIGTERSG
jgi:hypothetical protein